ncbi:hypothetical protein [Dactylosporangium sp. NPDC051541]|uniref:hypothetical protein n=1 Tax=Dactylosporangium sp. NPDC051541 TaxID=3363977 RepID=UPI0037AD4E26
MSTTAMTLAVIVLVLIVAAAVATAVGRRRRTRELRQRFGPEYDRAVTEQPTRRRAEQDLRHRERRHEELTLHELEPGRREQYAEAWQRTQAHFAEAPQAATREADELVTRVMADRGYPVDDFDTRVGDLSVEHAQTIGHYREAHEISEYNERGLASTEQLRQALMHYRALFADLLGDSRGGGRPATGLG